MVGLQTGKLCGSLVCPHCCLQLLLLWVNNNSSGSKMSGMQIGNRSSLERAISAVLSTFHCGTSKMSVKLQVLTACRFILNLFKLCFTSSFYWTKGRRKEFTKPWAGPAECLQIPNTMCLCRKYWGMNRDRKRPNYCMSVQVIQMLCVYFNSQGFAFYFFPVFWLRSILADPALWPPLVHMVAPREPFPLF